MQRALAFGVPLTLVGGILVAQGHASVAVGAGTVRYTGGTTFSSASISPAAEFTTARLTASGTATIASLPQQAWSTQGRGDVWVATRPLTAHLRLGAEAILAGTSRTDDGWSAAAHAVGEVFWFAPKWGAGLGLGPSAGWIDSVPSVTALHLRARGWWEVGAAYATLTLEPTRFLGAWFTDVGTGATWVRGRVTASLYGQARLSAAYGSTAAATAAVQAFVSRTISLEFSGGSYLRDPYQGFPRAGYLTFGVRFHTRRGAAPAATQAWQPLTPTARGDSLIVRFHLTGAKTVAIAGDWNAWKPKPLRSLGRDLWEGVVALRPGLYHFNLLVDGTEWVVPRGVATVSDGLGGITGVLTVQ